MTLFHTPLFCVYLCHRDLITSDLKLTDTNKSIAGYATLFIILYLFNSRRGSATAGLNTKSPTGKGQQNVKCTILQSYKRTDQRGHRGSSSGESAVARLQRTKAMWLRPRFVSLRMSIRGRHSKRYWRLIL